MRFEIARGGSGLTYEIRNIVLHRQKASGIRHKDHLGKYRRSRFRKAKHIPDWMKEVLIDIIREDVSYAYSPTKGVDATRTFIADSVNSRGKIQITPEDVIFFNGSGRCDCPRLQFHSGGRPHDHAGANLFHAFYGGSSSCFFSIQYLPDESL